MIWQWAISVAAVCLSASWVMAKMWAEPYNCDFNAGELASAALGFIGLLAALVGVLALIWWR